MSDSRTDHACALITRNNRDYIMVLGGTYGPNSVTIEFYDLTLRPNSWETLPGITMPVITGSPIMIGGMFNIFDKGICEAFVISYAGIRYVCSGNYTWSKGTVPNFDSSKTQLSVVDANLLGGETVW